MSDNFLMKQGSAVRDIARHLLKEEVGNRLDKVSTLAERYGVSVGSATKAIHFIESKEAVVLHKQGRNGTFINKINYEQLLKLADIGNVVCAMPLPYTKHYEGLAGGFKKQISAFPFYFAHMRGAAVRAECLADMTYQMAIMSKLSALSVKEKRGLKIILSLGAESYTQRHVYITKKTDSSVREKTLRIGVDQDSPDQMLLTNAYFKATDIDVINVPYNECLNAIESGFIDGAIWCPSNLKDLAAKGLSHITLNIPECAQASEVAVCINNKSEYLEKLILMQIDVQALRDYQEQVIAGKLVPSY